MVQTAFNKIEKANPVTVLAIAAGVTVLLTVYISNTLTIRTLLDENTQLNDSLTTHKIKTDHFFTETHLLESVSRIQEMATKEFGMAPPVKPPMVIQVPQEDIERLTPTE